MSKTRAQLVENVRVTADKFRRTDNVDRLVVLWMTEILRSRHGGRIIPPSLFNEYFRHGIGPMIFAVLADPALEAETFEDLQAVVLEAYLLSKEYFGHRELRTDEVASMDAYISWCMASSRGDSSANVTDFSLEHLLHFVSLPDLPSKLLYPFFSRYSREQKAKVCSAMNNNPIYMLRLLDEGRVPDAERFAFIIMANEMIVKRPSVSKKHPLYGRFWNACRNMLRLSRINLVRDVAEQLGEFVSLDVSEDILSGIYERYSSGGLKSIVSALRLGGKKEKARDGFVDMMVNSGYVNVQGDMTEYAKAQVDLVEALQDLGDWPAEERYHHPLWSSFYGNWG